MFFPIKYKKPVLISIVEAAQSGWNARCSGGGTPGSGLPVCESGSAAGAKGSENLNMMLYTDHKRSRWFEVEDINEGF